MPNWSCQSFFSECLCVCYSLFQLFNSHIFPILISLLEMSLIKLYSSKDHHYQIYYEWLNTIIPRYRTILFYNEHFSFKWFLNLFVHPLLYIRTDTSVLKEIYHHYVIFYTQIYLSKNIFFQSTSLQYIYLTEST